MFDIILIAEDFDGDLLRRVETILTGGLKGGEFLVPGIVLDVS
jgi:hypothetical protein